MRIAFLTARLISIVDQLKHSLSGVVCAMISKLTHLARCAVGVCAWAPLAMAYTI